MKYKNRKSMPRWKASLITAAVIAGGFYASADLEARNNSLFQKKAALETTQQNYGMMGDSFIKPPNPAKASQGQVISKR
jgi:hypothetical protein